MADFEEREQNFNSGIAQIFGGIARDLGDADADMKDRYAARMMRYLSGDVGNFEVLTEFTLVGLEQKLTNRMSAPKFVAVATEQGLIDDVFVSMDMEVSSHQSSETKVDAEVSASVSVEAGLPFAKVGASFSAKTSVGSTHARSSDYRAKTHAEMKFVQKPAPEGVLMIRDFILGTQAKAMEMNQVLIEKQAERMLAESNAADDEKLDSLKQPQPTLPEGVPGGGEGAGQQQAAQ